MMTFQGNRGIYGISVDSVMLKNFRIINPSADFQIATQQNYNKYETLAKVTIVIVYNVAANWFNQAVNQTASWVKIPNKT